MIFGILCIFFLFNVSESLKQLSLRYNNKEFTNIVIDKQIGVFYFPLFDGDEQVFEYVVNDYLSMILQSRKEPKIIYKYKNFLSTKWQEKYSVIVDNELDNLNEIVKLEKRYIMD